MKINILFVVLLNVLCVIRAHDKWIVLTTINYPTEALRKLAQLDGWRMVVVADKKTPVDWYLDNCDFLSVEQQKDLNFKIIELLPWNHYSRKNIGYLYAIAHGARIIYETDDDNYLINTQELTYLPKHYNNVAVASNSGSVVNPYAYFGQPTIWPRGYPLQQITVQEGTIEPCSKNYSIAIEQGLVNSDPDVDAIFRLTRKEEVYFDKNAKPLIFEKNTYCPFNTQNTLFHYDAFWGLLIPITVSFRVSDIWRSYWVQRLLWEIDAQVCFIAPTAHQYRNQHNLLKDFIDEYDLYVDAGRFVQILNTWKSHNTSLQENMIKLMDELVTHQLFKQKDCALMQAWINDLQTIGYQFPSIICN